ncbi:MULTISPECIES: SPFH domain-containing protein [unclassified Haladaptatus]|uniref:SPFH domain-containing protein n=1 Tax=unclassified Haladaptatus TaxID=2622732 RepID=UPI00209BEB29|nr:MULTISPECIES: SPFH domain-containing protein [unclassified Haladaptatus]MCO8242875.1 SPFH/Band 7/PHB domain protein [Haladaptatus sp. AB643]MCO8252635.1 SPFH/Band 7/PHB domain protein [Haladaptatus sp. AB618]
MDHPFYKLGKISGGSGLSKLLFAVVALLVFLFFLPTLNGVEIVGFLLLALVVVAINSAVEIVGAYEKRALVVFGDFRGLLGPGLHFIPPFVSATHSFDMRTHMLDVPKQEAITEDNSPLMADAVIYVRVTDAKQAYLEVDDYRRAVSNLGQTTLRAVLGDMSLDETLSRRDEINARIRKEIDPPTDEWGVHVESVEVQEVMPSPTVVEAMEQQTSAERRRRAMILEAQGERHSAIERAEGEKTSNIIRAQGKKQSDIITAQGDAVATTLRAKSAEAMGERAVIEKGMETLQAIGEGKSTKFVLPQELTSTLGRYGKHLTGSDVREDGAQLESKEFDAETKTLLGLDDIDETLAELESPDEPEPKPIEPVEAE